MPTPEQDQLLADAIALRADAEGLVDRILQAGQVREVNAFWARMITRLILLDRDHLDRAIRAVMFAEHFRAGEDHSRIWDILNNTYVAARFSVSMSSQRFDEELANPEQ